MEIKTVDVDTLTTDPNNARTHDARNLQAIQGSLDQFGQVEPLVVQASTGKVIGGNGRLAVMRDQGKHTVEVVEVDVDDQQAAALGLALNRTAELADWDTATLAELTESLEDMDLDSLGFNAAEIGQLLDEPTSEPEPEPSTDADDDAVPLEVEAITKPGEVVQVGRHILTCGDCIEWLAGLPENSVDAVVTDPPYGIGFMGKGWDCAVPGDDFAREALRVLKPGGHLIAFAATRTVHRLTVALEDAGFEVRDLIGWLQWQGFPKSLDVSKAIDNAAGAVRVGGFKAVNRPGGGIGMGFNAECGTCGKWKLATDPCVCRDSGPATPSAQTWQGWGTALKPAQEPAVLCRKPLEGTVAENVQTWGVGALNIDGCRIGYGDSAWPGPGERAHDIGRGKSTLHGPHSGDVECIQMNDQGRWPANIYHCPKPSRGEREAGCEDVDQPGEVKNHHPTVKPIGLMRWLVRLVTPPGGVVAEPFAGSGTTLVAAEREGVRCIGAEREPAYCDIVRARVSAVVGTGG